MVDRSGCCAGNRSSAVVVSVMAQSWKSKKKCADNTVPCYYNGALQELVVEDMWTEG